MKRLALLYMICVLTCNCLIAQDTLTVKRDKSTYFKLSVWPLKPELSFEYILNNEISIGSHINTSTLNLAPSFTVTPFMRFYYKNQAFPKDKYNVVRYYFEQGFNYGKYSCGGHFNTIAIGTQFSIGMRRFNEANTHGSEIFGGLRWVYPMNNQFDFYEYSSLEVYYASIPVGPVVPIILGYRYIF